MEKSTGSIYGGWCMKWFKIYKKSFGLQLATWMAYRFNFFLFLTAIVLFNLLAPLVVYLIYYNNLTIPGWTFNQVLFLLGTYILVTGIDVFLGAHIEWTTRSLLKSGEFDKILIRPIKPMTLIFLRKPEIAALSEVVLGIIIVLYTYTNLNIVFNLVNILVYLILIFIALLFLISLRIFIGALTFFFIETSAIGEFVGRFKNFAIYPISIYGTMGYKLFTFIFPIGLLGFYPAEVILGRAAWATVGLSAVVGLILFIVSIFFWEFAIKHYVSAGG
jgi:ABC-2 type transport system permease protein